MLVAKVTKTKMAERLCQMQAPFLRDCDIELQLQVADERNQTSDRRHERFQSAFKTAGFAAV